MNWCPLLFAKGRPTSWASTNSYSVFLIRDSCSSGKNRSDMPCWFRVQDATIGYDAAILSRWSSELYWTTILVSVIRPALYHLATKTITKRAKEVPFVVGILAAVVLTSDYCCRPFQTSLISPKRLSLHKVMLTSMLVSSSRLER